MRSIDSLPLLPVRFNLSPGATIFPDNGSLQFFSQGPVTYTVKSEDGEWVRSYRVAFVEQNVSTSLLSFEHVDTEYNSSNGSYYHVFYEEDSLGVRSDIWATGNAGVALVMQDGKYSAQGYVKNSILIEWISHASRLGQKTSGTLNSLLAEYTSNA